MRFYLGILLLASCDMQSALDLAAQSLGRAR